MTALYSVGTWEPEGGGFTPQNGIPKSLNITIHELRAAMKLLQYFGYSCHRVRDADGGHDDNDPSVLIERTDGEPEADILERWGRLRGV